MMAGDTTAPEDGDTTVPAGSTPARGSPQGPDPAAEELTVRRLLDLPAWRGARPLAGAIGLDRRVRFLNVMTVPDIVRWTKPDELLITTGYPLPRRPAELSDLVRRLADRRVSALAVKFNEYLPELPPQVTGLADRVGLPVVSIPADTPIDELLTASFSLLVAPATAGHADALDIHGRLLKVVLAGGGLGALVHELSGLLGGAVVAVVDATGEVRATAGPADDLPEEWGRRWGTEPPVAGTRGVAALAPVRAGNIDHGWVVVGDSGRPLPGIAPVAVEDGAVIAALEMTRDLAVLTVERQFAYETLRDLLTVPSSDAGETAARAARFGWDLERSVTVLVGDVRAARRLARSETPAGSWPRPGPDEGLSPVRALDVWLGTVRDADARAAIAGSSLELLAVVDTTASPEHVARRASDAIAERCGWRVVVGTSRPCAGPAGMPRAYKEARTAVRVAGRAAGADPVSSYERLGLSRFFHELDRRDLQDFVDETLGPLLRLPPATRAELITTLEVVLDERLNIAEASRRLHYHYNTTRYRIVKLEQLLGNFGADADARVALEVALRMMRFLDLSESGELDAPEVRLTEVPGPGT